MLNIGAGTIFRLGAKIGEKQSRQSNSKYNFSDMYIFRKGICIVQLGRVKAPKAGEFSRIFVLKVTLQPIRILLTVSYRNKMLRYR